MNEPQVYCSLCLASCTQCKALNQTDTGELLLYGFMVFETLTEAKAVTGGLIQSGLVQSGLFWSGPVESGLDWSSLVLPGLGYRGGRYMPLQHPGSDVLVQRSSVLQPPALQSSSPPASSLSEGKALGRRTAKNMIGQHRTGQHNWGRKIGISFPRH